MCLDINRRNLFLKVTLSENFYEKFNLWCREAAILYFQERQEGFSYLSDQANLILSDINVAIDDFRDVKNKDDGEKGMFAAASSSHQDTAIVYNSSWRQPENAFKRPVEMGLVCKTKMKTGIGEFTVFDDNMR